MTFKISLIMPVYNSEKYLKSSIDSIITQTIGFNNIEFIIIDDCSTDNSKNIIKQYSEKYSNIIPKFLNQNTGFPGNLRNIGIKMSHAPYLMFLDADNTYDKEGCEKLYNIITNNDVNIVDSRHKVLVNNSLKNFKSDNLKSEKNEITVNPLTEPFINNIHVWAKIYRKSFIEKYNITFPQNFLGEDNVFILKSFLNSDNIIFLNKYSSYYYNIRDENDDLSLTNYIKKDAIINSLKTYNLIVKILKEYKHEDLIPIIFNKRIPDLLSYFVRVKKSEKKEILEEFYRFYKNVNFNIHCNEFWALLIEKQIIKKKYKRAIFISEIIKKLYNSKFIKNIYRRVYLNIK